MKTQPKIQDDAGDVINACDLHLLWIFFQSGQYAACGDYASKWDVWQGGKQSREDLACSTKKSCAFMRVYVCHFPEFNYCQCTFWISLV